MTVKMSKYRALRDSLHNPNERLEPGDLCQTTFAFGGDWFTHDGQRKDRGSVTGILVYIGSLPVEGLGPWQNMHHQKFLCQDFEVFCVTKYPDINYYSDYIKKLEL